MTDHEPDPELLTRLHAADPASSLPGADPRHVSDLLEATTSSTAGDPLARPTESREDGTHDRSPLTWLVAAASVLLIAGAGVMGLAQRGTDSGPAAAKTVTRLGYVPREGRCVPPQTGVLREQDVAFRGRLVTLVGGSATFDVTRWYAGGPSDLAKVTAPAPRLSELMQAARMRPGGDYLVSASGGVVTACGFSGPATARLQRLYEQAFG
ncbi:MAG: hypothetical protein QM747_09335 [Nocardioides sp.]